MSYLQIKDIVSDINQGGMVMEFGVHFGNTFWEICAAVEPRHVYGFDSFWGLPEDWHQGTANDAPALRGTYSLYGQTPPKPRNGEYVVGYVQETLEPFLITHTKPVDFVHFDMNLGSATGYALKLLEPRLRDGTVFLFDDIYNHISDQEKAAFDEFLVYSGIKAKQFAQRHDRSAAFRLKR
jgi:Methyltransferase domain